MQDTINKVIDYQSGNKEKTVEYGMTHMNEKKEFVHFKIKMGVMQLENQEIAAALEVALENVFKIAEHEIIDCFKKTHQ